MEPQDSEPQARKAALLECGAKLEIIQQHANGNIELTLIPKDGIPIADSADIKDGRLRIRMTVASFLGAYQLMNLMIFPEQPKQKFSLTKFLFGV